MTDKLSNLKYPLLLDGGLSNELEALGCNLNSPLWTADVLRSNPEAIILAHLHYLEAGADIITTASYQATFQGFKEAGINQKEAASLILMSVDCAVKAVEIYARKHPDKHPVIAASVGPYGAYLADGSEYRGRYSMGEEDLLKFHEAKIRLLDNTNADLLACETVPSFAEGKVLCSILETCKTPSWISFSCKDDTHISDGTRIEECILYVNDIKQVWAVGVNCTKPSFIHSLIQKIKKQTDKKIIVYPNSGEEYRSEDKSWVKTGEQADSFAVKDWHAAGADIIGGCCRVGPAQISEVNKILISLKRN